MLVLSRNVGEAVLIGEDIEVVVQQIHGNQVRLAFKAPRKIDIFREELVDRRKKKALDMRP